jgi:hypothetical protein
MNLKRLTLLRRPALLAHAVSLALLTIMLTTAAARAEVYKWVDKDGVTHYSDRPAPGATEVTLPAAQTYQAPPAPVPTAPRAATVPAFAAASARTCEIRSPKPDETLRNVQSIVVTYSGPEGMTAVLLLNNKRYTGERDTNRIVITPASRGTYEAILRFVNARNEEVCKAPAVTFFIQQPSIIRSPARGRRPG